MRSSRPQSILALPPGRPRSQCVLGLPHDRARSNAAYIIGLSSCEALDPKAL